MLNVRCFPKNQMPTFSYRALQSDGTMTEGQLDAPGRPDALRQVETLGLRPVSLA
jgi:type II secretory pathway component PulF